MLNACPWGLLHDPAWRAAVDLWRFSEVGAVADLMHAWSAQVAWGVLAFRDALAEWRAEKQREAMREANGG